MEVPVCFGGRQLLSTYAARPGLDSPQKEEEWGAEGQRTVSGPCFDADTGATVANHQRKAP